MQDAEQVGKTVTINHDDGGESWTALVVSVLVEPDGSAASLVLDAVSTGTFEVVIEADTSGFEAALDRAAEAARRAAEAARTDRTPRFCPSCGGPIEINWLDIGGGAFIEQIPSSWSCPNPECLDEDRPDPGPYRDDDPRP